ncbi:MAG TPA: glycosyltransferase family 4 protein [Actinomycetaceae bacterium]|nr:glycosyltransferase family 4 protein [Actinomycetaceae bacterium]
MPDLRLIVPARDAGPSGGDIYDAQLARAWEAGHGRADVIALPGRWPQPGPEERRSLSLALRGAGTVLLDGLVGSPCPHEVDRAVRAGTRVVLLVHLPLPAETGLPPDEQRRLAELEKRAVHAASHVVTTSHWAARDLIRRYQRDDVIVALPGADRAAVAPGSRPPQLLVLGALTAVKNHSILVPALAALRELPWQATFAGPTEAQPAVAAQLVSALAGAGLTDRVTLPGTVRGSDLEELWQRTDLLLVPSLVETYGLVVTEALARAIPAVVAAGTGAVEALTGIADATPAGSLTDPAQPAWAFDPASPGTAVRSTDPADPGTAVRSTDPAPPGTAVDPTDAAGWEDVLRRWLTTPELGEDWRRAAQVRRGQLRTWADTAADLRRGLFGGGA